MRSKPRFLVGVAGFEPTASKSQTSRATSCATPRLVKTFNFSVKSVSGQICGQRIFAEPLGRENTRKCEKNGDFASFRGRLVRRSHAPKPRALPTALHPDRDIEFWLVSGCFALSASAGKREERTMMQKSYFYYTTFESACQVFEKSFHRYCDFLRFLAYPTYSTGFFNRSDGAGLRQYLTRNSSGEAVA